MRLSIALWGLVGSAALAAAQNSGTSIASLPPCALTCITSSLPQTKCSITDLNCVCNDPKLNDLVAECVLQKCTKREGLTAKRISAEQCGQPPRDRGNKIIVLDFVCFSIAWAFFFSRIATRTFFKAGTLGLDDLFLTLAMVCTTGGAVTLYKMVSYGLGRDVWYVSFEHFDKLLLWYWIGEYLYVWYTGFVKISLCYFFLRIFNSTHLARFIYAAIIFQGIVMFTFTFVIIFQCRPINYTWKFWDGEHEGTCLNVNAASWSIAALTISLDVLVLALPIRELWRLKMNKMKKFYIMAMFGLGFVVTIISCLRLQALVKFGNTYNVTYDGAPAVYWSTLEGMFGSVALCLPTLRAFMAGILPCWFAIQSSTTKQYSSNQGSNGSGRSGGGQAGGSNRSRSIFSRLSRRRNRGGNGGSGGNTNTNGTNNSGTTVQSSEFLTSTSSATNPRHLNQQQQQHHFGPPRTRVRPNDPYGIESFDDDDEDIDDLELFEMVEKSPTKMYHESIV